jgi:hypothetical protein
LSCIKGQNEQCNKRKGKWNISQKPIVSVLDMSSMDTTEMFVTSSKSQINFLSSIYDKNVSIGFGKISHVFLHELKSRFFKHACPVEFDVFGAHVQRPK